MSGFPMHGDNFDVVCVPLEEYERARSALDGLAGAVSEFCGAVDRNPLYAAVAILKDAASKAGRADG